MTELQHTVSTSELYERLINRLGLALETASTATRLRNELPAELELAGLSKAELALIEAYLEKEAMAASGAVKGKFEGCFTVASQQAVSAQASQASAKVIWLKDKRRANSLASSGRYSPYMTFKR